MRLIAIAIEENGMLRWGPPVLFRAERVIHTFVQTYTAAWNDLVARTQPLLDLLVPCPDEEASDVPSGTP